MGGCRGITEEAAVSKRRGGGRTVEGVLCSETPRLPERRRGRGGGRNNGEDDKGERGKGSSQASGSPVAAFSPSVSRGKREKGNKIKASPFLSFLPSFLPSFLLSLLVILKF